MPHAQLAGNDAPCSACLLIAPCNGTCMRQLPLLRCAAGAGLLLPSLTILPFCCPIAQDTTVIPCVMAIAHAAKSKGACPRMAAWEARGPH